MNEKAYNNSREEVFLFTINHNPPQRVLEHLELLKGKKKPYIVSFFTGEALEDDPYRFPEGEVIRRELGSVLDSRSFIQAKIE